MGDLRDEVGAVELYYPQIGWTGICADRDHIDSWRNNDQAAEIVCRQLGYDGGAPYVDRLGDARGRQSEYEVTLNLLTH